MLWNFLPALVLVVSPKPAAQFCAEVRPAVQALVKSPLTIKMADDATTDVLHTGDTGYFSCTFAAASGYQLTVILSDDPSKASIDFKAKGYEPLAGFGDRARVAHGSLQFVDVMKGKTFCEVLVVMPDDQFVGADWPHAAGKMCMAALAAH